MTTHWRSSRSRTSPRTSEHARTEEEAAPGCGRFVSLTIDHTTRLGVVGESGSGKSTLSRIIVGLETPTSGRVAYRGVDVHLMTASVMRSSARTYR